MFSNVVITGSLAFDHIMSMSGRFSDHILPDKLHILNVSFIMNTFRQEFGGTGGNIAYTLGLLKTPCILVASAGKDFTSYRKHLKKIKEIDLSAVRIFKNTVVARGFVVTDADDNQIWGFYEGAMKMARKLSVKKYLNPKTLLMIAPNDTKAMENYVDEAIYKKTPYIFDPAFNIPHFDLTKLKKAVVNSTILMGNDYEIELIRRRLAWSKVTLVNKANIVISTCGRNGVIIEIRGKKICVPAAVPRNESDPTGAGDAFRAGFLAGFVRELPLDLCGKIGALTAVYTVERYGTQTHTFSKKDFCERYRENYNEDLQYNF